MASLEFKPIKALGARTLAMLAWSGGIVLLLGQAMRWVLAGLFSRKVRFRWGSIAEQMVRVGVKSLPIVILAQVFIGVILALQMTPPLKQYNSQDQVAVVIGIAGFRMLGPIITAVLLSGFAGASIAAELGTMVVSEEIEAMEATALNPIRFLVVPRMLATSVMTVLLAVVGDLMIGLGGYITSWLALGQTYVGYWQRMHDSLEYRDVYTGLIQAAVFGLLISMIACYEGLKVSGGAEGVGRATTMTVVYSIVSIIASAGIFTAVFFAFGL